jgi:DNA-binding NarL/FixJ family response regulator
MNRIRVLLADDHRIVAEGLRRLLETEFELAGVVEDGKALLVAAQKLKPDVIISDISMPELNGVEALGELKKLDPDVKLVFLTMHHNAAYARRALDAGALGYVLKHSATEELIMAVRAAYLGRTFVSPAIAGDLMKAMRDGDGAEMDPVRKLTLRQREILRLLVDGHTAKVIASRLDISARTVEFHKYSMMESLELSSTAELIRFALNSGVNEI